MAILRSHGSDLTLAALTVAVFVTMSLLNPGKFLTTANFESMAFQFPELALLSLAMLLAMLSGGIDLSVVAVANLCGILAAMILTGELSGGEPLGGTASSLVLAVVVAVGCGACCGSLNGLLISRLEVSPILATLGTMQIFTGAGLVLTSGRAVHGFPESFLVLGNGSPWGVPIPFVFFAAAAALVWLLSSRTSLGIHMRLLGTNPTAALFSGIRVNRVLFRTYLITGILAAVTGLLMIARTNSAKADYGSSYLLQAILVAVLGGVNPAGGFGHVRGVCVAVLALQFLSSGFAMLHLSTFARGFIWGVFLLLFMVMNQISNRRLNQ
ncbi:MAG: ABC transporter permease [Planctomycetes bacterium]|nr:ABC transporter permease [Planctomycetota bacterium]